ncbi:MAG: ComEA family DNA-binding protein [Oscillospiraceae bacterium]
MKKLSTAIIGIIAVLSLVTLYRIDLYYTLCPKTTAALTTSSEDGVVVYFADPAAESAEEPAGLININTATEEQLISLPMIGKVRAAAIIEYRERHGSFISLDELAEVDGISPSLLDRLRKYITV